MSRPANGAPHTDRNSRTPPAYGPIRGSSRKLPLFAWMAGAAFFGSAIFAALYSRPVPGRNAAATVALAVFALVGLTILWHAALATLRWVRFRDLALTIDPCPAESGGTLTGTLVLPVPYDAANLFNVEVECTEYVPQGGSRRRSDGEVRQLVREEARAQGYPAPAGTRLAFRLPLPREGPPSENDGESRESTPANANRASVRWTLRVTAEVEGIDVEEEFEIPVCRPKEVDSSPGPSSDNPAASPDLPADALPRAPVPEPARDKPATPAYVYERIGNRIRVTQPAWTKSLDFGGPLSWLVGIGPSFGFVAIGAFVFSQPGGWPMGVLFMVIGAGCIALFAGYFAHSLTVDVDDAGIHIENRVFGFLVQEATLPRGEIVTVYVKTDRKSMMVTRDVIVMMRDLSEHLVAQLIPRERDAVILRNLIASRLAAEPTGFAPAARRSSRVWSLMDSPVFRWFGAIRNSGAFPWLTGALKVAFVALPLVIFHLSTSREGLEVRHARSVARPAESTTARPKPALADRDLAEGEKKDAIRPREERPPVAERQLEANDPLAARQLVLLADRHVEKREYREAEPMLRRALAILEGHSHALVRARVGSVDPEFDRESVLRKLAWALWELRRYQEALAHYQAAYATVAELGLEEGERNARLAYGSAGIMVNACRLNQWETADQAMAELKQRMQRVPDGDRQWLQYWVRTGEPRLASRRC